MPVTTPTTGLVRGNCGYHDCRPPTSWPGPPSPGVERASVEVGGLIQAVPSVREEVWAFSEFGGVCSVRICGFVCVYVSVYVCV